MGIGVFFAILDVAGIANRLACAGCSATGVGCIAVFLCVVINRAAAGWLMPVGRIVPRPCV